MITTTEELKGTKIRLNSIEESQQIYGFAKALGFKFTGKKKKWTISTCNSYLHSTMTLKCITSTMISRDHLTGIQTD